MRTSPRPKAIGEAEEVSLVNGAQHFGHGTLGDFVLQRRYTEWSLSAVGLRYIDPPDRPRAIAARVNLRVQSLQIVRKIFLIAGHRLTIHSRCGASLESAKRSFQCGYIDVMQQGSESCALVPPCCFADPRKIRWQSDPTLRPDSGDLAQFSLRPTPSLRAPRFLRRHHRYYESV